MVKKTFFAQFMLVIVVYWKTIAKVVGFAPHTNRPLCKMLTTGPEALVIFLDLTDIRLTFWFSYKCSVGCLVLIEPALFTLSEEVHKMYRLPLAKSLWKKTSNASI